MRLPKELIPVVLILAALIAVNVLYRRIRPSRSPQAAYAEYTSYSAGVQGTKAFYLLLEKLGYKPKRLRTPYYGMQGGLAVVLAPNRPIDAVDAGRLMEWIRQGNTLLLVPDGRETQLTGILRIKLRQGQLRRKNLMPSTSTNLTAGIQKLVVQSGSRIRTERKDAVRHFRDRAGVAVISLPEGEGTVVVLSDPYLVTNAGLPEGDNLNLLVNVLLAYAGNTKTIYFDEYHHGFERRQSILHLLKGTSLGWALIQIVVAVALLMYSRGRRFGQPKPALEETHRSSLEYVTSLANIYQAAQASDIALSNLHERLLRSVRRSTLGGNIGELVDECERKMNRKISERELLDLSRRMASAQHPGEGR